jgi:hypothetical protein
LKPDVLLSIHRDEQRARDRKYHACEKESKAWMLCGGPQSEHKYHGEEADYYPDPVQYFSRPWTHFILLGFDFRKVNFEAGTSIVQSRKNINRILNKILKGWFSINIICENGL